MQDIWNLCLDRNDIEEWKEGSTKEATICKQWRRSQRKDAVFPYIFKLNHTPEAFTEDPNVLI